MSDQTSAVIDESALPDYGTDTEGVESSNEPFLGKIVTDTYEPGRDGLQWHIAVRPLNFNLAGETGAFHTWCKPTDRKNSKMLTVAHSLACIAPGTKLGRGLLNDKVGWFNRIDIPFGVDKLTNEPIVAKGVLVAVRAATADELSNASAPGDAGKVEAITEYTPELVGTLLSVINGQTRGSLQRAVLKTDLPAPVKQAVLNGDAITYLTSSGLLDLVEGTYKALTTAGR